MYDKNLDKIPLAIDFATRAHDGTARRWTNEPYINHPLRVASLISDAMMPNDAVVVALLHDVLEDTTASAAELMGIRGDTLGQEIAKLFGPWVYNRVAMLTNVDHTYGDRAARVAIDHDRLASLGDMTVHSIKCADMIDNVPSILQYADMEMRERVVREKRELIPRMIRAEKGLWARANKILAEAPL